MPDHLGREEDLVVVESRSVLDAHQRRLLGMIGAGMSAAEAADEMGVRLVDVARSLQEIRARLEVTSTAEAVDLVRGGPRRGDGRG